MMACCTVIISNENVEKWGFFFLAIILSFGAEIVGVNLVRKLAADTQACVRNIVMFQRLSASSLKLHLAVPFH